MCLPKIPLFSKVLSLSNSCFHQSQVADWTLKSWRQSEVERFISICYVDSNDSINSVRFKCIIVAWKWTRRDLNSSLVLQLSPCDMGKMKGLTFTMIVGSQAVITLIAGFVYRRLDRCHDRGLRYSGPPARPYVKILFVNKSLRVWNTFYGSRYGTIRLTFRPKLSDTSYIPVNT